MEGPDPYGAEYQLPISDLDLWARDALCLVFPDNCSLRYVLTDTAGVLEN